MTLRIETNPDFSIGHINNTYINTVKDKLTAGQAGLVCGSNRVGGRKQKPAGIREEVLPMASFEAVGIPFIYGMEEVNYSSL